MPDTPQTSAPQTSDSQQHSGPLVTRIVSAPEPFDRPAAERALAAVRETAAIPAEAEALLTGVFGCAPYLARLARRFPADLSAMLAEAPERRLQAELAAIAKAATAETQSALDAALRQAKARVHLLTALADLGGVWALEQVTGAITAAADAALAAAIAAHARFLGAEDGAPGYFIVALGKQGARELNYSSDIDIAAFYDPDLMPAPAGAADPGQFAVRLTKGVVASLSRQTNDGYVFRTDLRLRPDPSSNPVAVSVDAAARYYESAALTWERAAWIKARPVAGDMSAAAEFMQLFQPFVWRRSMDYAAIGEIAAIMRQIEEGGGGEDDGVAGLDIKRCAGGIRHIEFFTQMQQLLWGGREEALRLSGTLPGLAALTAEGKVEPEEAKTLAAVYRRLRDVEHRIQMLEDQPTQDIPEGEADRARLALLCGAPSREAFEAEILSITSDACAICAALFADAPRPESPLVFEGPEPGAAALRALDELGFEDPAAAWEIISRWCAGGPRAMRSDRARVLARKLAPRIAQEIAAAASPAATLARFDEFVRALPAGVQILSMLEREPRLLADIIDVLALSPRLARELAERPDALEAFLAFDPEELAPDVLEQRIAEEIGSAPDLEAALDRARRLTRETMFLIAMGVLRGQDTADHASDFYVTLAGALIRALLPWVQSDLRRRYGAMEGQFAVIALGSFGASEMTVRSDTDIVMVYDASPDAESDGDRPLYAETYYGRLAQRFVSALTAPTAEGTLFRIDLNLRPHGSAGPIASRLSAYENYYRTEAWTWELMALTRARVVAGDPALADRLTALIREVLTRPREAPVVAAAVADMRGRLMQEKPPSGFWDLVQSPGALTDVRFTVQYLQLVCAASRPSVIKGHTRTAIAALKDAGALSRAEAAALDASAELHLDLRQILALADEGPADPENASIRLKTRLARAAGAADIDALKRRLRHVRAAARTVFETRVLNAATESGSRSVE